MKVLPIVISVAVNSVCHAQAPTESGSVKTAHTFHILVGTEKEAKQLQVEIERAKPEARLAKFKEVARRASIDPSSKAVGGDLERVYEGEMVRPFEDAIFGSAPNELIPPFKSEFGWHLAYVTEFQELPVSGICRPALKEAYERAQGQWKDGLALAMRPIDPATFEDQVRAVIGIDWAGPMKGSDGNILFIRSREGYEEDLRSVSQHIEFPQGMLEVTARPKGCSYSARIEWSIHCDNKEMAFMSFTAFEGRGAIGRALRSSRYVDPSRAEYKPIAAGSLGAQLHGLACAIESVKPSSEDNE